MASVQGDVEANVEKATKALKDAQNQGCDLFVLPEFWATGYDLKHIQSYATSTSDGIFSTIADLAKEYQIAILGSNPQLKMGSVYNTAVLFDKAGQLLASYDKVHLFSLMEEEKYLTAGSEIKVVDSPWGRIGLSICFDLRFPELYRRLMLDGAEVTFIPAYWPAPRLEHWRLLVKARALENQMFVVACNRAQRQDRRDFGFSAVIDPYGEVVVEAGLDEVLLVADIDPQIVHDARKQLPFLECRRNGLY